jgi:cytochrome P450
LTELKDNADLIGGALSEVLRYESPVQIVRRLAREDMELGGQKIKEGEMVVMLMGSANRDPEMFDDPDKFDIHRENSKKHIAYGHGIHYCLGSSLADAEGEIAISTLFRRLPGLKLRSEQIEIRMPFALRGPKTLPVLTR